MPQESANAASTHRQSAAAGLARMFPRATRVWIPVRVTALSASMPEPAEHTVIEYGTSREVLFASVLPLEFEDRVRVENSDGSLRAEASVVAVRLSEGGRAVAARFLSEVGNWIIKP